MTVYNNKIAVIDPTKSTPTYVYDDIGDLSRDALNAFTVEYVGGSTPVSPTDTAIIAGGQPPDASHPYTPAIANQSGAATYMPTVVYPPVILSEFVGSAANNRGVQVVTPSGTVDCFCVIINKSDPTDSHFVQCTTNTLLQLLAGPSPIPNGNDNSSNLAGEDIEIFLARAADVAALNLTKPLVTGTSGFNKLNGLTRFTFKPTGSPVNWLFSNIFIAGQYEAPAAIPAGNDNTVYYVKALKPLAASDPDTFVVNVAISNPTPTETFDPGMSIAINNAGQNRINTKTATDSSLVWNNVNAGTPSLSSASFSLTVPGVVVEGDVFELFLRVLGDDSNLRTFTVTAPTIPSSPAGTVTTSGGELFAGHVNVALLLDHDYGLQIDRVNIIGTLYQSNQTQEVPDHLFELTSIIEDGTHTSVTKTSSPGTAPGTTSSGSHPSGTFAFNFAGSDFSPNSQFPYSSIAVSHMQVRVSGGGAITDFYPKSVGLSNDSHTTFWDVPIVIQELTSTSGIVTASIDIDSSSVPGYQGFVLVNPLNQTSGAIQFIGDVVNGPPPGGINPLPSGQLAIKIIVAASGSNPTFSVQQTVVDTGSDGNGDYNTTISSSTPGQRDLNVGDVVNIQILDLTTSGNPVVPIFSASPTAGSVENGSGAFPPGTLTITITQAMIDSASISGASGIDEDIVLAQKFGELSSVTKFRFFGNISDAQNNPIPDGATLLIHNVTQNLLKLTLVQGGLYDVTFESANFGFSSGTPVATTNDVIRYILFEDLFPALPPIQPVPGSPQLQYPDPSSAGNDKILCGIQFVSITSGVAATTPGPAQLLTPVSNPISPSPIINPNTCAIESSLLVGEINADPAGTPPDGQKRADFTADFHPTVVSEIIVQSLPIDTGLNIPIRALPYLDIVFPTNTTGGIPFEFEFYISNNANDSVIRWDPILDLPDLNVPGQVLAPGSINPFRLHIFTSIAKTAHTYAIALKVVMKRNDATGHYRLNDYGCRWWYRA